MVLYRADSRAASSKPKATLVTSRPNDRSAVMDPPYRWGAKTMFGSDVNAGSGDTPTDVADHVAMGSKKPM